MKDSGYSSGSSIKVGALAGGAVPCTDDVVYVSAQVRQQIQRSDEAARQALATLDNKGRKTDKHGNHWRGLSGEPRSAFTANYSEELEFSERSD